jgi:hypothetical protein
MPQFQPRLRPHLKAKLRVQGPTLSLKNMKMAWHAQLRATDTLREVKRPPHPLPHPTSTPYGLKVRDAKIAIRKIYLLKQVPKVLHGQNARFLRLSRYGLHDGCAPRWPPHLNINPGLPT